MAAYNDNRIKSGALRNEVEIVLTGTNKDSFGGTRRAEEQVLELFGRALKHLLDATRSPHRASPA